MSIYLRARTQSGITSEVLHLSVRLQPLCGTRTSGTWDITGPEIVALDRRQRWEKHAHWPLCAHCGRKLHTLYREADEQLRREHVHRHEPTGRAAASTAAAVNDEGRDTMSEQVIVDNDGTTHREQRHRNERGELCPACSCGWQTVHAYYGDRRIIEAKTHDDWLRHVGAQQ